MDHAERLGDDRQERFDQAGVRVGVLLVEVTGEHLRRTVGQAEPASELVVEHLDELRAHTGQQLARVQPRADQIGQRVGRRHETEHEPLRHPRLPMSGPPD